MHLVYLNRDALAVVPDLDRVVLRYDLYLDHVHGLVILKVISGIHQDLICDKEGSAHYSLTEYLVQPGNILDLPIHDLLLFLVEHPQVLLVHLDTADVGVRSDENVLELCLLLVDLLNVSLIFISVAPAASRTERLLFLSL